MEKKELLEQVPTVRAGDRLLRRRRMPRGVLRAISRSISSFFKSKGGK